MGHRLVVVLSMDTAHEWEHDPELGKKILEHHYRKDHGSPYGFQYGDTVEMVHADITSLVCVHDHTGEVLATRFTPTFESLQATKQELERLAEQAQKYGFTLVKE